MPAHRQEIPPPVPPRVPLLVRQSALRWSQALRLGRQMQVPRHLWLEVAGHYWTPQADSWFARERYWLANIQ